MGIIPQRLHPFSNHGDDSVTLAEKHRLSAGRCLDQLTRQVGFHGGKEFRQRGAENSVVVIMHGNRQPGPDPLQKVHPLVGVHGDCPEQQARTPEVDYRSVDLRMPLADFVEMLAGECVTTEVDTPAYGTSHTMHQKRAMTGGSSLPSAP